MLEENPSLCFMKSTDLNNKSYSYTKDFHKENKEKMKMREQESKQKIEDEKANAHSSNNTHDSISDYRIRMEDEEISECRSQGQEWRGSSKSFKHAQIQMLNVSFQESTRSNNGQKENQNL